MIYYKSNYWLGRHHTEEAKLKNRIAHLGKATWSGKKHTEESKLKMRLAHLGKIMPINTKIAISLANKGKKLSKEHIAKISKTKTGKKLSIFHRKRLSESHMGKIHAGSFKPGQTAMEKSYRWKGGISFEKYTINWTNTLKRSIRERDKYTCQLCSKEGNQVHHIDYNKKNCNPNNLITLCISCHMRTNNNRQFWTNLFDRKRCPLIVKPNKEKVC